ncbi:MAG: tol-pal system protein YbgF [Pseudomonadota bacterium]|jgi:tol-pal system protein YbgF
MALRLATALLLSLSTVAAQASIFADDDARKAIVDLRQRLSQMDARSQAQSEELQTLRKSLLDLNTQIDQLRGELAASRGAQENLTRELSELQRKQRDLLNATEERVRRLEPVKVTVDGREITVEPQERRGYEEAVAQLRSGDFNAAANALSAFLRRWPATGYAESAQFWLGNALYGKRDYKESIAAFRVTAAAVDHPRAAEALLAIANCQVEMKDNKAARATLNELLKAHPNSDAAKAGRERLSALK